MYQVSRGGNVVVYSQAWSAADIGLQRDLAVLRTLAHVQWLTTEHIHALCFPGTGISTVRMTLRAMEDAGYMWHTRWRIKTSSGSHLWTMTAKGLRQLEYYGVHVPHNALCDLVRPSTSFEHVEWRIGLAVRKTLTCLVLEARRTSLLAHICMSFPSPWSGSSASSTPALSPDVLLSIVWMPSTVHSATWLPWVCDTPFDVPSGAKHYALFFDRMHWGSFLSQSPTAGGVVRIVLLGNDTQQSSGSTYPVADVGQTYPWTLFEQDVGRLLQRTAVQEAIR